MTVAVAEHSGRGVQAAGRAGHHETPAGGGSEGVHLHHGEDCQRHGQFSTPPLLGHCPAAVFLLLFFARLCILTDMVSSPLTGFRLLLWVLLCHAHHSVIFTSAVVLFQLCVL